VSEYDDPAAKDRDVDIPSSDPDGSELASQCAAVLKREEDVEADEDRDHATGASQAAINKEEDPPA
jgi:hypothetical protein